MISSYTPNKILYTNKSPKLLLSTKRLPAARQLRARLNWAIGIILEVSEN